MNTMNEKRYALVWDDSDEGKAIIGTAAEIAMKYVEAQYEGFKVDRNEDGDLMYWLKGERVNLKGEWVNDWEECDQIDDLGDPAANLVQAFEMYFRDYIEGNSGYDGYAVYELDTTEQEEAFSADIEVLLDRISFKEARDNDLDPEYDENGLRAWYYEHKANKAA